MKYRVCAIYVALTKVLISCMVTAQLICTFAFAYAKSRVSHDAAQLSSVYLVLLRENKGSGQSLHAASLSSADFFQNQLFFFFQKFFSDNLSSTSLEFFCKKYSMHP